MSYIFKNTLLPFDFSLRKKNLNLISINKKIKSRGKNNTL
jgi:hypothetical protein